MTYVWTVMSKVICRGTRIESVFSSRLAARRYVEKKAYDIYGYKEYDKHVSFEGDVAGDIYWYPHGTYEICSQKVLS